MPASTRIWLGEVAITGNELASPVKFPHYQSTSPIQGRRRSSMVGTVSKHITRPKHHARAERKSSFLLARQLDGPAIVGHEGRRGERLLYQIDTAGSRFAWKRTCTLLIPEPQVPPPVAGRVQGSARGFAACSHAVHTRPGCTMRRLQVRLALAWQAGPVTSRTVAVLAKSDAEHDCRLLVACRHTLTPRAQCYCG